mgnify:CR=1 FL=1
MTLVCLRCVNKIGEYIKGGKIIDICDANIQVASTLIVLQRP